MTGTWMEMGFDKKKKLNCFQFWLELFGYFFANTYSVQYKMYIVSCSNVNCPIWPLEDIPLKFDQFAVHIKSKSTVSSVSGQ